MDQIQQIREYAAAGLKKTWAADQLGLTEEELNEICQEHGIYFNEWQTVDFDLDQTFTKVETEGGNCLFEEERQAVLNSEEYLRQLYVKLNIHPRVIAKWLSADEEAIRSRLDQFGIERDQERDDLIYLLFGVLGLSTEVVADLLDIDNLAWLDDHAKHIGARRRPKSRIKDRRNKMIAEAQMNLFTEEEREKFKYKGDN